MPGSDDLLDDLFLGCALTAYLEQAQIQQGWPDSEATRRRAYRMYAVLCSKPDRMALLTLFG